MDQEKSLLLQKQIRDNSEDLQKELLDLKNWEEEMKRKEEELLNSNEEITVLPPIRSKKKKVIETSPPVPSTSKASVPERIKSYDYSAWNQFDVDAACRKLDEESETDEEGENLYSEAEKKHTEALKFKTEGNEFFQKKQYALAIGNYSQAIKIFPYDEAFYANRALCYLKQDNLYSAEADCTAALQIDNNYVKAYHRRASARIGLENYNGAKQDIQRVLELEPSNKGAEAMLLKINKKLEKLQPLKISELHDDTPVEKKIGEKICNASKMKDKLKNERKIQEVENLKKNEKSTKLTITEYISESDNEEVTQKTEKSMENTKSGKLVTEVPSKFEKQPISKQLPDWLPKLDENYSIVEPIELAPHLRSKGSMKKVTIKKVNFGNSILPKPDVENHSDVNKDVKEKSNVKIEEIVDIANHSNVKNDVKEKSSNKSEKIVNIANSEISIEKTKQEKDLDVIKKPKTPLIEVISSLDVPSAPKTSVQFLMEWKTNKSLEFRSLYLKQIPPDAIPALFKDSMESNVFEDIIFVLREEFTSSKKNIFEYLEHLSNVKRFRTLIMFIEGKTKKALNELLVHCKKVEGKSQEEIDRLRQKYEL